jgi:hypothetical protein
LAAVDRFVDVVNAGDCSAAEVQLALGRPGCRRLADRDYTVRLDKDTLRVLELGESDASARGSVRIRFSGKERSGFYQTNETPVFDLMKVDGMWRVTQVSGGAFDLGA